MGCPLQRSTRATIAEPCGQISPGVDITGREGTDDRRVCLSRSSVYRSLPARKVCTVQTAA